MAIPTSAVLETVLEDMPDVLEAKVSLLAEMVASAANMVAYTGAGTSVNCGSKHPAAQRWPTKGPIGPTKVSIGTCGPKRPQGPQGGSRGVFGPFWGPKGPTRSFRGHRRAPWSTPEALGAFSENPIFRP